MKTLPRMTAIALAATLGLGLSAGTALAAQQTTPTGQPAMAATQATSDATITANVKAALAKVQGIHPMDVTVTTKDGVVTLAGTVSSSDLRKQAIAAAKGVDGVNSVDASKLKVQAQ